MTMRRLLGALFAVALAFVAAPGCYDHSCEGDVVEAPIDLGDFVDDTTWESIPMGPAAWLDFPGKRTWKFRIPKWEAEGRPFVTMSGYVSAASNPDAITVCAPPDNCPPADNWTTGGGSLLEFSQSSPGRFSVTNDTCSPFYLRVVMHSGLPTVDSGAGDAQSE
jgi:hypothetical protein